MSIGKLRHRITLQTSVSTRDSIGVVSETWSDTATVYAQIEAISGREFFEAGRFGGVVTHRVRIRHRADIIPAMRVLVGDRVLDIRAVLDVDGRKRELTLMCAERV